MEKEVPQVSNSKKRIPKQTTEIKDIPKVTTENIDAPKKGNVENIVTIGGVDIEIKPTKLIYQRDRTARFYRALDIYPLMDILGADAGLFDKSRDGDKCLFDWLIAATDNADLIKENYNDMDTELIYKIHEIFKRVNKITEKEEEAKNRMAKETSN